MEEKKTPKANLESWKVMFFLIGLVISLIITWRVFEWKSYNKVEFADVGRTVELVEEEMVEVTKQEQKPQPVEVPKQTTQIQIVDDNVEVKEDLNVNAEMDQDEKVEEYVAPEIEEEDISEREVFTIVEEMPDFPGGMAKLGEYLAKNIKYPQMAREAGIQGKVFINFVVEKDGSIADVKVMRGIGGGCDEEAIRVVKSMPKWKPGKQRGKAVRVSYNLPVNFKLQ